MAETTLGIIAAILIALFPIVAPVLAQVVKLVHALRIHPNPRVRRIARRKLPPPQKLDDAP